METSIGAVHKAFFPAQDMNSYQTGKKSQKVSLILFLGKFS